MHFKSADVSGGGKKDVIPTQPGESVNPTLMVMLCENERPRFSYRLQKLYHM